MNLLTPKLTWLSDKPTASAHGDLMASPMFKRACEAAMLTYQQSLLPSDDSNPQLLAGVTLRLAGAQGFLRTLLNLSEPAMPETTPSPTGLVPPEQPFWSDPSTITPTLKQPLPILKG